jgi:hypothetical protein
MRAKEETPEDRAQHSDPFSFGSLDGAPPGPRSEPAALMIPRAAQTLAPRSSLFFHRPKETTGSGDRPAGRF